MSKLEILNSIEVLESDFDCECTSIIVKSSKKNIEKLLSIGASKEDIKNAMKSVSDEYNEVYEFGVMELVGMPVVWEIAGGYSVKEGFVSEKRILELTNEEKEQYIPSNNSKVFVVYDITETIELGESVEFKLFRTERKALSYFKKLVSNEKRFLKENDYEDKFEIIEDCEGCYDILNNKSNEKRNIFLREETVY